MQLIFGEQFEQKLEVALRVVQTYGTNLNKRFGMEVAEQYFSELLKDAVSALFPIRYDNVIMHEQPDPAEYNAFYETISRHFNDLNIKLLQKHEENRSYCAETLNVQVLKANAALRIISWYDTALVATCKACRLDLIDQYTKQDQS